MKWEPRVSSDGSGGWLEASSPVGEWAVSERRDGRFNAVWYPLLGNGGEVEIGRYKTEGTAKAACKRYAKRMAAAFKTFGKSGWQ